MMMQHGSMIGWVILSLGMAILPVQAHAGAREDAIDRSIESAVGWIATFRQDPFARGIDGFRNYVLEVESLHRLWLAENAPSRRGALQQDLRERLHAGMNDARLRDLLADPDAAKAYTDFAVLADRCGIHGIDAQAVRSAMASRRSEVAAEVARAPASLKMLYATYLPAVGLEDAVEPTAWRDELILSRKPREADLTLADVYYLTHEIFAVTDYAYRPLAALSEADRAYLLRVLPFYAVFYGSLGNLDIMAEVLTCLYAAGMTDTWAYQDGLRTIVERQNPDGSFGSRDARTLGRAIEPADYLHPTMNCLWALLLERSR